MNLHPAYITSETGQRVSAVLPIEEYQALLDRMEELEDLAETCEVERMPPQATPDMLARRKQALEELRALGGLREIIPDPAAWQRELR